MSSIIISRTHEVGGLVGTKLIQVNEANVSSHIWVKKDRMIQPAAFYTKMSPSIEADEVRIRGRIRSTMSFYIGVERASQHQEATPPDSPEYCSDAYKPFLDTRPAPGLKTTPHTAKPDQPAPFE